MHRIQIEKRDRVLEADTPAGLITLMRLDWNDVNEASGVSCVCGKCRIDDDAEFMVHIIRSVCEVHGVRIPFHPSLLRFTPPDAFLDFMVSLRAIRRLPSTAPAASERGR